MNFLYSPYIVPLIPAGLASVFVAVYAWSRRSSKGALGLFILSFAVSEWIVGYAFEIMGADISTKYFWGVIQYFGIALTPYGWLIFSVSYNDLLKSFSRRFIILTSLIPSITILLAFTTKWHGLIWSEYHINQQGNFSALAVSYGIWFWVHFAYSYVILLIGAIFLVRALFRKQGMYRGQIIAMLIAALAPWIGNALYLTGNSPIPYLDLTPFAFTVSVAALAWAIFGFHLVDITPIARDRVVESMQDGMIVINTRGIIVDINPAAGRMIGITPINAIGKPVEDILSPWSHLIVRFRDVLDAHDEITIGEGSAKRNYEVRLSPLSDPQKQVVGRVVILHALETISVPPPRFAPYVSPATPKTDSESISQPRPGGVFGNISDFLTTPIKTDLKIPADINPGWYQTRERSFTIILRICAVLGSLAYIFTLPFVRSSPITAVNIIYGGVILLLWYLGLARKVNFSNRAGIFLGLIYAMSFMETLNFGFSVESFTFFMTLIIISVLLIGRLGAIISGSVAFITLLGFGWLISQKNFIPYNLTADLAVPRTFEMGMTSLFVLFACAIALASSITILIESLSRAWQKETQALNLLQQERDLLEQRVNERARELLESEARFRQIVENASDIIYRTDMNGHFTYANPSALRMMGFANEAEVLGKSYLDLTTPEARHRLKRTYERQLISKTKNTYYEFPAVTVDGEIIWVGQNVQLIMDGEQTIGFQALARNITQLKQAQEALLIARDQALDASRLKSQLLSRVSHELRTPLGGILGYAELLQAKAFGTLTEKQENALGQIVDSTHFLTKTVNDLLDEAQIEARSTSLDNNYFLPSDLLNNVISSISTLARQKNLGLHAEISPELPSELYGDIHRLQQILVNLAGNAIKFTRAGEVRISFNRPSPAQWSMEVRDTGVGIPREEFELIFEPFRQVNNSITRENRGSGLGLAISKQLIELMDGQIAVQSELGKGSVFIVLLPIKNPPGE